MHSLGLTVLACGIASNVWAQGTASDIGRFNAAVSTPPSSWQVIRFDPRIPPTQYRVTSWDGVAAVEALAEASMAILARPLAVDLLHTPVLCWRWRVDAPLKTADMASKFGDDYAARIYVAFSLPAETMNRITRAKLSLARSIYGHHVPDAAINYVWDNRYPIGTQRPNAYTERTKMMVLRSGDGDAGAWVMERRDVLRDAARMFGTNRVRPTLLAVAADTDNTGESARAGFADLHFVSHDAPCVFSPTANENDI